MPSLGHAVVGLAVGRVDAGSGRPRAAATVALLALSLFPDLDILARTLGAGSGSVWLHRGALHSLPVAVGVGALTGLFLSGRDRLRLRLVLLGAAVAASHGLLDTLTGGGAGLMLLWPFSTARFLAPAALLPAAPMGLRLLSRGGLAVVLRELLLFGPLLAWAVWPRRPARSEASRA